MQKILDDLQVREWYTVVMITAGTIDCGSKQTNRWGN